jgi:hypothetical protein
MKSRRHPWTAAGDRSPRGHVMASQFTSHPAAGHTLTGVSDTTAPIAFSLALRAPFEDDRSTGLLLQYRRHEEPTQPLQMSTPSRLRLPPHVLVDWASWRASPRRRGRSSVADERSVAKALIRSGRFERKTRSSARVPAPVPDAGARSSGARVAVRARAKRTRPRRDASSAPGHPAQPVDRVPFAHANLSSVTCSARGRRRDG